jgi:hypothetical protein
MDFLSQRAESRHALMALEILDELAAWHSGGKDRILKTIHNQHLGVVPKHPDQNSKRFSV